MNTTQWSLLAAFFGALIVAGLLLTATGIRGVAVQPGRPATRRQLMWRRMQASMPEAWASKYRMLTAVAALAAVATWVVTLRPVHGLIAAAAVLGLPWIWNPAGTAQRQIVRLEALAEWLQQLAGMHQSSATLETSISASATRCPQAIRPQVRTLAARLRMGVDPAHAYRQFADQFADGAVDNVVLLFLTHTQDHGSGLSNALKTMSQLTSAEANSLRSIDAERNRVRVSTRWVSLISMAMIGYTVTGSWGEVYRTATGQLVLIVLATLFAAALWWLRRMAYTPPDPRLLDPLPTRTTPNHGAVLSDGGVL
ncbi:type II secretion system F family protein [Streptomyces sp. B-S-A8]|uniref:Type II secretion system F family protein n=1 Tax=Streptomyces solicavernae TaxID=3043614 RepID=A0ABT6S041_9ACTN|nr:type II secretion system F family protein [Streptomyces sp. B-S-A8]MDI3390051.1 type II secretion system F family protein [Streptomyces sp. B-S-A8]